MTAPCGLAENFYDAMLDAWSERGADAIAHLRQADPAAYLRLMAGIVAGAAREDTSRNETAPDLDAVDINLGIAHSKRACSTNASVAREKTERRLFPQPQAGNDTIERTGQRASSAIGELLAGYYVECYGKRSLRCTDCASRDDNAIELANRFKNRHRLLCDILCRYGCEHNLICAEQYRTDGGLCDEIGENSADRHRFVLQADGPR